MKNQLNRQEAETFLAEAAGRGSVLGLEHMQNLMEELSNVQEALAVIHVAGTNGKGSVCAMAEQVLRLAGYRTGWYSSPRVFSYEEIYQVNGQAIGRERLHQVLYEVKEACRRLQEKGLPQPTLFEIETAAAFLYFQQEKCDVVLLETGLGGRLDATNVIKKPLCSVITSVSRDHMQVLGESLSEIAAEKAGIIKPGCPVVSAPQRCEVQQVIREACRELGCVLWEAEDTAIEGAAYVQDDSKGPKGAGQGHMALTFSYKDLPGLSLSLLGACQPENAACVIELTRALQQQGVSVTEAQLRQGLLKACWPGRFEVVSHQPLTVLDGAHNEDAAKKLRKTLETGFTNRAIIYIIGVLADKEYEKILEIMLPLAERAFTVTPDNPRALSGEKLCQAAAQSFSKVIHTGSLREAWQRARETAHVLEFAGAEPMVVIFGSLSYLGEMKQVITCTHRT